jgi:hypothetical protein
MAAGKCPPGTGNQKIMAVDCHPRSEGDRRDGDGRIRVVFLQANPSSC